MLAAMPMQMVETSPLDILHGIINGHTVGDHASRAVDIQGDILFRILSFQVQQLGHHNTGDALFTSSFKRMMRSFSSREKIS